MKAFISLVRVMLKMSLIRSGQAFGSKKRTKLMNGVSMVVLYLALLAFMTFIGSAMAQPLIQDGLEGYYAALIVMLGGFMVFATQFSFVTSTLFYADDVRIYLSMPITPAQLIGAKFTVLYLESFLILGILTIPYALAGLILHFTVQGLIAWILILLLMPLIPLSFVALLMLVMLKLIPPLRNTSRLAMSTGLITILGAASYSFLMQTSMVPSGVSDPTITASMPGWIGWLYPIVDGAPKMVTGNLPEAVVAFAVVLFVSMLWLGVTLLAAAKWFVPIVLSMDTGGHSKKKVDVAKTTRQDGSAFKAFFQREIRNVLRSPIYLLNGTLMPLLLLIIMGVSGYMGFVRSGGENAGELLDAILPMLHEWLSDPMTALTVGVGVGIGMAMEATTGTLVTTTITREAHHLDFLKSVPVPARTIFSAKFWGDFVFVLLPLILLWIVVFVFVPFRLLLHPVMILVSLLAAYGICMINLLLDVKSPKLDWMDEMSAMKSNKNVFFSNFLSFGFLILLVPLAMNGYLKTAVWVLAGLFLLAGIVLSVYIYSRADRILQRVGKDK